MRTTIDLPEELYRTLKARAALNGLSLRELIQRLIEASLRSSPPHESAATARRGPPPVIVPPRGVPIPARSGAELRRIEEEEDEEKHAGSA